ncbi:hypothetical protein ACEWF9_05920, partial [Bifidobacterium longum subsp. longum]|uniref:hypothetical protein n=1 Tax=Bifidobacterium longum TaxID=216816 RepID=UPI00356930CA
RRADFALTLYEEQTPITRSKITMNVDRAFREGGFAIIGNAESGKVIRQRGRVARGSHRIWKSTRMCWKQITQKRMW